MKNIVKYKIFDSYPNLINGSTTKHFEIDAFLNALNYCKDKCVIPKQVHGNEIIPVNKAMLGKGEDYYIGDSLITNEEDIILVVRTADCLPILLYEETSNVIGVIHGGWRGLGQDIIGSFIDKAVRMFNIKLNALKVTIGPAINKNCYSVRENVIDSLSKIYKKHMNHIIEKIASHQWNLDLKLLAREKFKDLGVLEENIEVSPLCTHCNSDLFYSFRRDKEKLGKIYSIVGLKK